MLAKEASPPLVGFHTDLSQKLLYMVEHSNATLKSTFVSSLKYTQLYGRPWKLAVFDSPKWAHPDVSSICSWQVVFVFLIYLQVDLVESQFPSYNKNLDQGWALA